MGGGQGGDDSLHFTCLSDADHRWGSRCAALGGYTLIRAAYADTSRGDHERLRVFKNGSFLLATGINQKWKLRFCVFFPFRSWLSTPPPPPSLNLSLIDRTLYGRCSKRDNSKRQWGVLSEWALSGSPTLAFWHLYHSRTVSLYNTIPLILQFRHFTNSLKISPYKKHYWLWWQWFIEKYVNEQIDVNEQIY